MIPNEDILIQCSELFMRLGVRSVNMDDVARELKISKKTLYKHVKDKGELVKVVMRHYCDRERVITNDIFQSFENAIDELVAITRHVSKKLSEIHPSVHFDLQKYYPEAWAVFDEFKHDHLLNCIAKNLKHGIDQGLFRKNLNPEIIARLHVGKIDLVFDGQIFPSEIYRSEQVYLEMMKYHIRGIASEEGLKYLAKKINEYEMDM